MKGILFTPDMIEAIVAGKKTETRRVIKPQPPPYCDTAELLKTGTWDFYKKVDPDFHAYLKGKPRYQVGETVYIKEAHWYPPEHNHNRNLVAYRLIVAENCGEEAANKSIWKSPLFMPAWAARYFIRITGVRAQRLQEITHSPFDNDCHAEGFNNPSDLCLNDFMICWDSINPKYPWESNPWVWVISFRR